MDYYLVVSYVTVANPDQASSSSIEFTVYSTVQAEDSAHAKDQIANYESAPIKIRIGKVEKLPSNTITVEKLHRKLDYQKTLSIPITSH